MISTPFCLYDCDVPVDGATAFVVSHVDAAKDLRKPPLRVEAVGAALHGRPSWDQWEDLSRVGYATAAAMWGRTDLGPADVDVAQLYDGFTIEVVWWLEALGFCGPGEAGAFVEGGTRIDLGGELPLNTWGGQLSGGRLHAAFGHTVEADFVATGAAGTQAKFSLTQHKVRTVTSLATVTFEGYPTESLSGNPVKATPRTLHAVTIE